MEPYTACYRWAAKVKSKSKYPLVFMWAAFLHDIGKPSVTKSKKGKITSYDHDRAGARLAREFLKQFVKNKWFVDEVCSLIRYHMQILFVINGLRFADIEGMKQHTDVHEVALLGLCDRLGRKNINTKEEEERIKLFYRYVNPFHKRNQYE